MTTLMTPRLEHVVTIASKVKAHRPILEKILSDLKTDDADFLTKNFALNSIIGSVEEYDNFLKDKEVTA